MSARRLPDDRVLRLIAGIERYDSDPEYDSVFHEVHKRISRSRDAGKADIAVVAFWMRMRLDAKWVRNLLLTPEPKVRGTTRRAFAAAKANTGHHQTMTESRDDRDL